MEYLLTNLNHDDIEKLNNSDIEWYHDDITNNSQEVTICEFDLINFKVGEVVYVF